MKLRVSIGLFFLLILSVGAKPGGEYVLTGREKSVFSIYQADMKAYPQLYEGEDINAYYNAFKELNDLNGGRKLTVGEKLMFPHTARSRAIQDAEEERRALVAEKAEAERRAQERALLAEEATTNQVASSDNTSLLFGYDSRNAARAMSLEEKAAREEARLLNERRKARRRFEHTHVPSWFHHYRYDLIARLGQGKVEGLVEMAAEQVDEDFAAGVVLHRLPDKKVYVLEFEIPQQGGECFFIGVKDVGAGWPRFFFLEKGISLFGVGEESVLYQWIPDGDYVEIGGRKYTDLDSFVLELAPANDDS